MTLLKARRTITQWVGHYTYGLFAKSFTSGVSALDAVIGTAVGATVSADIHAVNWKGGLAVFAITGARSALRYFVDNPIPEKLPEFDDTTPTPTP